ncbi:MAG: MGMT family protein [Pirellulaceae bacterium]|nr:MGMT family protein [Pirellulaceae bacterium]
MMTAPSEPPLEDQVAVFHTRLGWMAVRWRAERLQRVVFGHALRASALTALGPHVPLCRRLTPSMRRWIERLEAAAAGQHVDFSDVPLDMEGRTRFQRAVMEACRRIPRGSVMTYGELAARAGFPGRARAVGNVMASNPLPLVVPCHRVVAANGRLGGFSAPDGIAMKRRLLRSEDVPLTPRESRVPLGTEMC